MEERPSEPREGPSASIPNVKSLEERIIARVGPDASVKDIADRVRATLEADAAKSLEWLKARGFTPEDKDPT